MDIRKDKRGFSLIELIITMAIMAVFAGAIIGGMSYINAGKTKKAAARLNNKISSIHNRCRNFRVGGYCLEWNRSVHKRAVSPQSYFAECHSSM